MKEIPGQHVQRQRNLLHESCDQRFFGRARHKNGIGAGAGVQFRPPNRFFIGGIAFSELIKPISRPDEQAEARPTVVARPAGGQQASPSVVGQ